MDILKIKSVLKGKILGKGRMYNPVTQLRCAAGELLHAVGVPDTTLEVEEMSPLIATRLMTDYDFNADDIHFFINMTDSLAPKRTRITGDEVIQALTR